MDAYTFEQMDAATPPVSNDDTPSEQPMAPVKEGERHGWMIAAAGRFRAMGVSGPALQECVESLNNHMLESPLPEKEVQGIVDSAEKWKAGALTTHASLMLSDIVKEMERSLNPPLPVIDELLFLQLVVMLGGHGGVGKTYLALVIAAHVACGVDFAGQTVRQTQVLYATFEDPPWRVLMRLSAIIEQYNLDEEMLWSNFTLLDGTEHYAPLMTMNGEGANAKPVFAPAYDTLRQYAEGHGLIIIDNASDAFDANENARRHVRQFMHGLTQIARECNAAVLLLAHIDKNAAKHGAQGNSYSGSTAWHNSARSRLAIVEKDNQRFLRHEKSNFGPLVPDIPIDIGPEGVPLINELPMQDTKEGDRKILVEFFEKAHELQINVPPKVQRGAYSAMKALETLPDYPTRFQTADGEKNVGRLINQLVADQVLVREQYKDGHRNKKERLVLSAYAERGDTTQVQRV